jgi:signal transduction histidine kinase
MRCDVLEGRGPAALSRLTRLVCAGVAAAIVLLVMLDAAAAQPKRVLLLHSFGRDFKPWSDYAHAIRSELNRQSPWPLDLTEHALVTARSSDENPEPAFVEYLRALHAKNPPDLIVSIGAPAAAFVQRHRAQLFPTTPMLLTVVDQRRVQYSVLTENDAVVAVAINYLAALENILRVRPDTKNIMLVVGTSPIEKFWKEAIAKEAEPLAGRVALTWTDQWPFEELLKRAAALPPDSAIFWELMIVDAAGVVHEESAALARLHAVSAAPIFSYTDAFFGREIVGGPHVPVLDVGKQVAAVAFRILSGEKPGDIKAPPVGVGTPRFDWRELQRWNISESRLPPGSVVEFRQPTAWEQYRLEITTICAAFVLQAMLISWLLYERAQRRRSEAAAHALNARLINAQEEERSRLARELHDDVTQRLARLAIDAAVDVRAAANPAGAAMTSVRDNLIRLSEDVHALSYRLHPSILEDLGLIEALESECRHFSAPPIKLEANGRDFPEKLPKDVALCLFRIAQEALRNVARHATATQAVVRLRRLDGGLELTVRDDGVGFDTGRRRAGVSLGLASMRQRAVSLGGHVDIDSSPGRGTTVAAWVPLRQEAA